MLYRRYIVDLAIPSNKEGKVAPEARSIIAPLEEAIRNAKRFGVIINKDLPEEEYTTKAKWHICQHEEGALCGEEHEI